MAGTDIWLVTVKEVVMAVAAEVVEAATVAAEEEEAIGVATIVRSPDI